VSVTSTILLSGSQAALFDLQTSFLGQPKTMAYGLVRGAGNLVFQQQMADNSIVAFYMLGEGPWDSLVRLWLDDVAIALPAAGEVQFHNGFDGEIGYGMSPVSTGGDQHVDSFFAVAGMPGTLTPLDWSRYAYLALHYPPNPAAPDANLTVLGDYQAMRCRIFDASGNQTGFAWTQNPAWWICDFLIRKFILREGKVNQPLVPAELARFDWAAWNAAAAYYDYVISSGVPRFSDGGLVLLQNSMNATNALEQMLLMCQSYLLERNGKLTLYPDQPRSSVYLATIDSVVPNSFTPYKQKMQQGQNRITATWREEALADGSTDDGTRMSISTVQFDHIAHQTAIGARGPGLSVMPKVNELQLDFGIDTSERVSRLCSFLLQRQLGMDVDPNFIYVAPFQCDLICYEDSLAVECGDIITIDASVSEEFAGREFEVLQIEERPDGTRKFTCLEYISGAFGDTATPRQATQAPVPGTGLSFPFGLNASNELVVPLNQTVDAGNRYAPITGITTPTDLPYNGGFEIFPDNASSAEGWTPDWTGVSGGIYERNASPYSGNYAQNLRQTSSSQHMCIVSRPFGVKPGLQYDLRARVKAAVANTGYLYIGVLWYSDDSDLSFTGWSGQGLGTGYIVAGNTSNAASWTLWEGQVTAPAGAKFGRVILYNASGATAGTLTFDTCGWALYQVVSTSTAAGVTSLPTTSSATYAVIPEMSITKTTTGGKVHISAQMALNIYGLSVNAYCYVAIFRDGTQLTPDLLMMVAGGGSGQNTCFPVTLSWTDDAPPAAGSHTWDIRWKTPGAGYSVIEENCRKMQVEEIT
jgi:hypothetical protein